ncbi:hypothetical protein BH23ACT5_BH23ACT5_22210 [soil metagenome]
MNDRFHFGTFVWGLVLTLAGVGLLGVGLGWWTLSLIDLRYVAPVAVIVIGAIIVLGALTRQTQEGSPNGH